MSYETKKTLVILLDIIAALVLAAFMLCYFGKEDTFLASAIHDKETVLEDAGDNDGDITKSLDPDGGDVADGDSYEHSLGLEGRTLCMIGDSRFAGMHEAVGDDENVIWIAKGGAGHDWYWDNKSEVEKLPRDTVIIYELGVNSIDPNKGIEAIEDICEMGFSDIYALSIAPVDPDKEAAHGYHVSTQKVMEYNNYLMSHLPYSVRYMDVYTKLSGNITTYDGLHYDDDTYIRWYDIMVRSVAEDNE